MTNDALTSAEQILMLERGALDRWGNGDPSGFLELYASDISYFDPVTPSRIDGRHTMVEYYRPFVGKIYIARSEMLNPQVVVGGDMALLTYNLVNYIREARARKRLGAAGIQRRCFSAAAMRGRRSTRTGRLPAILPFRICLRRRPRGWRRDQSLSGRRHRMGGFRVGAWDRVGLRRDACGRGGAASCGADTW
jgi:SnoaL-like domain